MTSSGLPAKVYDLRLEPPPSSEYPYSYLPSPLSPESPLDHSPGPLRTPPTTPQSAAGVVGHPVVGGRIHPFQHAAPLYSRSPLAVSGNSRTFHSNVSSMGLSHPTSMGYAQNALHLITPVHHSHTASGIAAENKRPQNRRSAKRFRDAQKQRWKQMQDEISAKTAEIDRLKSLLLESGISPDAETASDVNIMQSTRPHMNRSLPPPSPSNMVGTEGTLGCHVSSVGLNQARSRSAISISSLVNRPTASFVSSSEEGKVDTSMSSVSSSESRLATEAQLYFQVLAAPSPVKAGTPYVAELGVLHRCFCAQTGKVLRGEQIAGLYDGLDAFHANSLRHAVASKTMIALAYHRHGKMLNAVVGPSTDGSPAVVAEFIPFSASSDLS